jgi:hypothetical protein
MAATIISPVPDKLGAGIDKWVITFATDIDGTSGGVATIEVLRGYSIVLHYESTNWNSKTLTFAGGNDGSNFYALTTAISVSANGVFPLALRDVGFRYYKAALSGAPTAALTLTVIVNRLGR